MPTTVYESKNINTLDGVEIEISPLKIKYLREFMTTFEPIKKSNSDDESIAILVKCAQISMKQFHPTFLDPQMT